MIDLHCHILPGIDDGPVEIGESVRMARRAAADGIRKIVAAPHITDALWSGNGGRDETSVLIDQKVSALNRKLEAEGIAVKIIRGGEVAAFLAPRTCERFTVNRTAYLLVEFPPTHLPANAGEAVFAMIVGGLRPIIAHPERNPSVMRDPQRLRELVQSGALAQITAGSLTGEFGPQCRECALHLLGSRMVSFIASDGHVAAGRPPVLSGAFEIAARRLGAGKARALVSANPEAVIEGRPLNCFAR